MVALRRAVCQHLLTGHASRAVPVGLKISMVPLRLLYALLPGTVVHDGLHVCPVGLVLVYSCSQHAWGLPGACDQ